MVQHGVFAQPTNVETPGWQVAQEGLIRVAAVATKMDSPCTIDAPGESLHLVEGVGVEVLLLLFFAMGLGLRGIGLLGQLGGARCMLEDDGHLACCAVFQWPGS